MRKFLITGITGFAGPHLSEVLVSRGNEVHGLIRRTNGMATDILDVISPDTFEKISFQICDLKDQGSVFQLLHEEQYDGIFHLAAQSHPPTSFSMLSETFDTNVAASVNLVEGVRQKSPESKLMFCSTSEVYGNVGSDGRLIRESDTILPANPYGVSKAAIDLLMQERFENGFLDGFVTRAFSHTGPRRGKNFSISSDAYQLADMIVNKRDPVLLVGNLTTTRVVMDVRDTVRLYADLMDSTLANRRVFNVCGREPHQMQFFTDKLVELSGLGDVDQKVHEPFWRPHEIYYQHGDVSQLEDISPDVERIPIEKTLEDLLQYWVKKLELAQALKK